MPASAICGFRALVGATALIVVALADGPSRASQEALGAAGRGPARTTAQCYKHPLRIGMTAREALASDWCYPDEVRDSTNFPGLIEYWFYRHRDRRVGAHGGFILIDDGIVTFYSDDVRD